MDIQTGTQTSPLLNNCAENTSTFSGVDFFKFFFAVCIVALHAKALHFLPETTDYMITRLVFRLAVPYFFIASGFFLGKKLFALKKEEYADVIRAYCLRLLKPLVFFEIISLLYNAVRYITLGLSLKNNLFLLGQSVVFYPFGALWYVQACIIGVLLLYPFLKRNKLNLAIIIGVLLYIFALLANNYSFLLINTPFEGLVKTYLRFCVSARNGLFTGFISIALGILCSRIHEKVCKRPAVSILLALAGFFLYVAEVFFIRAVNKAPLDDSSLYVTHLFFVPALFLATLQLKIPVSQKLSVTLRNLSTGIYFLHRPLLYITGCFISVSWLEFLVVLLSSIAICLLVYKTQLKPFCSLLK